MIALALAALFSTGLAAAPNSALEKCRALDKEFDTKNMPKPCQAAADDTTLAIPERVEALRRLAFAHILNGDDALAEAAFLRLLVFSPKAELPADAGPRFREVFAAAKARFENDGKLAVAFTPPVAEGAAPVDVQVDVQDRLGRVVGARVVASGGLEERLVRNELSPGNLRFTGRVPEPKAAVDAGAGTAATTSYEIVLDGWEGPVELATPLTGQIVRGAAVPAAPAEEPPWGIIAASAGIGVVVVGAATGGLVWCFAAGPCRNQEAWVRVQIRQGEAP